MFSFLLPIAPLFFPSINIDKRTAPNNINIRWLVLPAQSGARIVCCRKSKSSQGSQPTYILHWLSYYIRRIFFLNRPAQLNFGWNQGRLSSWVPGMQEWWPQRINQLQMRLVLILTTTSFEILITMSVSTFWKLYNVFCKVLRHLKDCLDGLQSVRYWTCWVGCDPPRIWSRESPVVLPNRLV